MRRLEMEHILELMPIIIVSQLQVITSDELIIYGNLEKMVKALMLKQTRLLTFRGLVIGQVPMVLHLHLLILRILKILIL